MKRLLFFPILALVVAACGPKETPFPTFVPTATPTPLPTATPSPSPTAVPTLNPSPVKLEMSPLGCPYQTVLYQQQMVIVRTFQFGKRTSRDIDYAKWIVKAGVETITIDGDSVPVSDPTLWSKIQVVELGNLGKYNETTFTLGLPLLKVGYHRITVDFAIPAISPGTLFSDCGLVDVRPW